MTEERTRKREKDLWGRSGERPGWGNVEACGKV